MFLTRTIGCSTVRVPIFTAKWHWGARILLNFDLLTRARARTGHNMSPATAPCARAPGVAMRAPGSQCIFTVLAISAMRGPQNGWLADSHFSEFMHAARAACMHAFRVACMHVNGIFSQPVSQSASQPGARGRAEAHMQLPTHPIMLPVHGQL